MRVRLSLLHFLMMCGLQIGEKALRRAKQRLQMPPYMRVRLPITEVLTHDPDLEGLETSKLVFTDITFGVSDRVSELQYEVLLPLKSVLHM